MSTPAKRAKLSRRPLTTRDENECEASDTLYQTRREQANRAVRRHGTATADGPAKTSVDGPAKTSSNKNKRENAVDRFRNEHQEAEVLEARGKASRDCMEDAVRHNDRRPLLEEILRRRRSDGRVEVYPPLDVTMSKPDVRCYCRREESDSGAESGSSDSYTSPSSTNSNFYRDPEDAAGPRKRSYGGNRSPARDKVLNKRLSRVERKHAPKRNAARRSRTRK